MPDAQANALHIIYTIGGNLKQFMPLNSIYTIHNSIMVCSFRRSDLNKRAGFMLDLKKVVGSSMIKVDTCVICELDIYL